MNRRAWVRTGWRANAAGSRVIEYTLFLPMSHSTWATRVRRDRPDKPWFYRVGDDLAVGGPYRTAAVAMVAVEKIVRAQLRTALRILER